jgi:hypothetical protein
MRAHTKHVFKVKDCAAERAMLVTLLLTRDPLVPYNVCSMYSVSKFVLDKCTSVSNE